jgi:hypothetical protein
MENNDHQVLRGFADSEVQRHHGDSWVLLIDNSQVEILVDKMY